MSKYNSSEQELVNRKTEKSKQKKEDDFAIEISPNEWEKQKHRKKIENDKKKPKNKKYRDDNYW
jgi:hypothetical protein